MSSPDVPSWMAGNDDDDNNKPSTSSYVIAQGGDAANTNTGGSKNTSAAEAARAKTWKQYFMESFQRDGRLLLITLLIIICMNIPFVKWVLYPFSIFSTFIHELCHGLAAVLAGGSISKLLIFSDTSGLAYTSVPSSDRRGFVASAGYQGTAVIGCLLLIFRRTKRGPRSGTMAVAIMMMLSVLLWIRNWFGALFIFVMGLLLAAAAWFLPSYWMRNLYTGLTATCSMNAITHVHNLFGSNQMVNGEPSSTDAHTMAELKGGSYLLWALLWMFLAIFLTIVGILFAIPGPDEVADFTCCGVCQDFGLFNLCNYPGLRLTSRFRESVRNSGEGGRGRGRGPGGDNQRTSG